MIKCSYCSGVFHEEESLEQHLRFYHLEEECFGCGSVFNGMLKMLDHISDFHLPTFTPFGHQCLICGNVYQQIHQALDHFRRRHVFKWNCISVPRQMHACPHCQLPFSSWTLMDNHVIQKHQSYGLYYMEPDYTAVDLGDTLDELVLLPCALCNDFFHEQIDLDKHIANDHEPLATRRSFNDKAVTFEVENIEYCATRTIVEYEEPIETPQKSIIKPRKKLFKLKKEDPPPTKPKKSVKVRSPSPEPIPEKKKKLKRIIIPKKRTLKKLALIEERRQKKLALQQEEITKEKEIKSKIDESNILSGRTRTRPKPSPIPTPPSRRGSAKQVEEPVKKRRFLIIDDPDPFGEKEKNKEVMPKSKRPIKESVEDSKKTPDKLKKRSPSQIAALNKKKTKKEEEQLPEKKRRYLTVDDPDPFGEKEKNKEVLPKTKNRGTRSSLRNSTTSQDKNATKNNKKSVEADEPVKKRKFLIVDDPDLFNDSDQEIMPTPKRRGRGKKNDEKKDESSEEEEESSSEEDDSDNDEEEKENNSVNKKQKVSKKDKKEKNSDGEDSDEEEDDDDNEDDNDNDEEEEKSDEKEEESKTQVRSARGRAILEAKIKRAEEIKAKEKAKLLKKKGKKGKNVDDSSDQESAEEEKPTEKSGSTKGRGRAAAQPILLEKAIKKANQKAKQIQDEENESSENEKSKKQSRPTRGRGRAALSAKTKKAKEKEAEENSDDDESSDEEPAEKSRPTRGRGRPAAVIPIKKVENKKLRGRKAEQNNDKNSSDEQSDDVEEKSTEKSRPTRGRGRAATVVPIKKKPNKKEAEKSRAMEPNYDDDLLNMSPKIVLQSMRKDVLDRYFAKLNVDAVDQSSSLRAFRRPTETNESISSSRKIDNSKNISEKSISMEKTNSPTKNQKKQNIEEEESDEEDLDDEEMESNPEEDSDDSASEDEAFKPCMCGKGPRGHTSYWHEHTEHKLKNATVTTTHAKPKPNSSDEDSDDSEFYSDDDEEEEEEEQEEKEEEEYFGEPGSFYLCPDTGEFLLIGPDGKPIPKEPEPEPEKPDKESNLEADKDSSQPMETSDAQNASKQAENTISGQKERPEDTITDPMSKISVSHSNVPKDVPPNNQPKQISAAHNNAFTDRHKEISNVPSAPKVQVPEPVRAQPHIPVPHNVRASEQINKEISNVPSASKVQPQIPVPRNVQVPEPIRVQPQIPVPHNVQVPEPVRAQPKEATVEQPPKSTFNIDDWSGLSIMQLNDKLLKGKLPDELKGMSIMQLVGYINLLAKEKAAKRRKSETETVTAAKDNENGAISNRDDQRHNTMNNPPHNSLKSNEHYGHNTGAEKTDSNPYPPANPYPVNPYPANPYHRNPYPPVNPYPPANPYHRSPYPPHPSHPPHHVNPYPPPPPNPYHGNPYHGHPYPANPYPAPNPYHRNPYPVNPYPTNPYHGNPYHHPYHHPPAGPPIHPHPIHPNQTVPPNPAGPPIHSNQTAPPTIPHPIPRPPFASTSRIPHPVSHPVETNGNTKPSAAPPSMTESSPNIEPEPQKSFAPPTSREPIADYTKTNLESSNGTSRQRFASNGNYPIHPPVMNPNQNVEPPLLNGNHDPELEHRNGSSNEKVANTNHDAKNEEIVRPWFGI